MRFRGLKNEFQKAQKPIQNNQKWDFQRLNLIKRVHKLARMG